MGQTLGWGILSTGNIAGQFAQGMQGAQCGRVVSVASRDAQRARSFADKHNIAHAADSYEALLRHPEVDAVYNALPNAMHHEWTLRALDAGKHVLCEKPLAVTQREAREMFAAAERNNRLLVEAFMYRSHPQTQQVAAAVRDGRIGRLRMIRASFCYRTKRIDNNVRFSAPLAGGALMDVGCYCVDLARLLTGAQPQRMHASAQMHEKGVDELCAGTLEYADGITASFVCGMCVQTDNALLICGEEGYISVPIPWKPPVADAQFTIAQMTPPKQDKQNPGAAGPQVQSVDANMPLYAMEADDFARAVWGEQPPVISAEESLGNMAVLEELRRLAGLPF